MRPGPAEQWARRRPNPDPPGGVACAAPWVSLEFDPQGWVYTCCANQHHPLGRIGDERLADLWGGPRARVLRESVQRWDFSMGCFSCRWHVEHGRLDTDAAVYDRYRFETLDPPGPRSMTFALSNRCNLGCVMCNGQLSSTIRHREGDPPIVNRYDDRFFEDLAPFLPGLEYAKFLGGEPLLIPEHERVWDLMDAVGGPPRFQITTNGTIWTDRVAWLLDRFAVDVTLSIDAVSPEVYESIRLGADHGRLLENVGRFAAACRRKGTELRFCFCLMTVNHHELAPFLSWADAMDAPVSVNVVSDRGLALHDLGLDELEAVARNWADGPHPEGRNRGVWETQVRQLDAVLAERRAGHGPAVRHARTPLSDLAVLSRAGGDEPFDPADERRRMERWGDRGEAGEVRADRAGVVVSVPRDHRRLGIVPDLVGRRLTEVVDLIAAADGRSIWEQDTETTAGATMVTYVLNHRAPVRSSPGTIVRIVCGTDSATGELVVLVGEDAIHERNRATAVTLSPGPLRGDAPAAGGASGTSPPR